MRRIVFIIDHFYNEQAGTENQLLKLIQSLGTRFELELISFRDSEWLRTKAAQLPCRVRVFQADKFKRLYTYRNLWRLIRHLRTLRPDVVHTFFPVANVVGVLSARLAGVRTVITSRRDYGEWMSRRYLYATRIANRFVAGIVANSPRVKELTERVEKFPGGRIEVIYNGIAVEEFGARKPSGALRSELGIPPGNKVVGLVANYRPMKRHATFVRAAAQIARSRNDISFVLVGKNAVPGEPKRKIEQLVAELGLEQRVCFVHAAGNVKDYLAMFDVGVNCSEGEGLSNAIMEYMAAKVPCVVSESGGNPDLITDGVHGYTFPLDDHAALAHKILHVLNDTVARERMVREAHAKVRSEMSLDTMIGGFERCYVALNRGGPLAADEIPKPAKTETRL